MRRPLIEFPLTQEDLNRLFAPSNELTVRSWDDIWLRNIQRNLELYPKPYPATRLIVEEPNFHTMMVCGAGWTLRKLKAHADKIPKSWGIICADRALGFLLDCGLEPNLVVTMDGDQLDQPHMQEAFKRLRYGYPKVPTLVDLVACPTITHQLRRPYFFRSMTDEEAKSTKFLREYMAQNNMAMDQLGHGGNVGSLCTIIAKYFYYARHVVLIGMNFSFVEGTRNKDTWEHREVDEDKHQTIDVSDMYGRPIRTMANLHNYRTWQEYFTHTNEDIEWINANDGGYLGVHNPEYNYNHYTYENLPQAIERLGDHGTEEH